jgi:predicted alpha/beta superfamily hydrolase
MLVYIFRIEGKMRGNIINEVFEGRKLLIYTPPSYKKTFNTFPVFYVQDGGDLFNPDISNALEELEDMFVCGDLDEIILVGVQTHNRMDEYTPWTAKSFGEWDISFGGKGFEYLLFLIEKLKPYICEKYRGDAEPLNTGIVGASFGGLISMYAALKFPHQFSKIGSISGSYWYPNFIQFMENELLELDLLKIYMDVGSEEGKGKTDDKRYMVERNIEVFEILKKKNIEMDKLKFFIEDDSNHGQKFFVRRFASTIKWLMSC